MVGSQFYGGWTTVAVPARLVDALGLDGTPLDVHDARAYREVRIAPPWIEVTLPGGAWRLALRVATQAGRMVVSELRVLPLEDYKGRPPGTWSGEWRRPHKVTVPPGGITARLLRRIRLGDIGRHARAYMTSPSGWDAFGRLLGGELHTPRRPGRARRRAPDDISLAQIANSYRDVRQTAPRRVIVALAAQLRLDEREVSQLVYRARKRGLLTSTKQGAAGGELTAKARRLLKLPTPPQGDAIDERGLLRPTFP
jgi:hypothetical protein